MRKMFENEYLPYCIAIGIGVEQFWNLNVTKLRPFLKAEEIKAEQKNREAHLQGAYIFDAVSIALANAFRKKGSSPLNYPQEPYGMNKSKTTERNDKTINQNNERLKAEFMAFARRTQKRLENNNNG